MNSCSISSSVLVVGAVWAVGGGGAVLVLDDLSVTFFRNARSSGSSCAA